MSSSTASDKQSQSSSAAPKKWMKCVNGVAPRTCSLNFAVSNLANVTLEEANELIKIGAVWARFDYLEEYEQSLNEWGMSQAPSIFHDDMQERQSEGNEEDEEDDLEEYIARLEYDSTYQRIMEPTQIQGGTDLRIYPYPRRFPACYEFAKNKSRLLYQDTTFVVVDKPPMLPTQPDASNYLECCPGCVNDWLGPFYDIDNELVERPLLCHRVDSCVGGCVVLSKDKNGQKVFSELQRLRKLKKIYLTLTKNPVPLGQHIHYMFAATNMRGSMAGPNCQLLSHTAPANRKAAKAWIRCVLEVSKSKPIELPHLGGDGKFYESTIRLVTGRKHQVRAQLASLNAPIVNDSLYEPIAGFTLDRLWSGADIEGLEEGEDPEEAMDRAVAKTSIPTKPIGLQAHAIMFGGVKVRARKPWWYDGEKSETS